MEQWRTFDEIVAARERMAASIEGWTEPAAHGVGLVPSSASAVGPEHFPLVNTRDHRLPAVVLASVLGHANGRAAYRVSRSQLEIAVERLAPAEAWTGSEHPNLWTWRDTYLPALDDDPGAALIAVFLDGGEDREGGGGDGDPSIAAFRVALTRQLHV